MSRVTAALRGYGRWSAVISARAPSWNPPYLFFFFFKKRMELQHPPLHGKGKAVEWFAYGRLLGFDLPASATPAKQVIALAQRNCLAHRAGACVDPGISIADHS